MRVAISDTQAALTLDDNAEHTIDLPLPVGTSGGNVLSNGSLVVLFKTTKTVGTNSTGLTVKIRPTYELPDHTKITVTTDDITLVSALDWTTATWYRYVVLEPLGVCHKVQVGFTYANGVDDSEEMTVLAYLVSE